MREIHALPGRIRIKNNFLYHDKALSQYINIYCDSLYGVKYSRVNDKTATVLIVYDENKTEPDMLIANIQTAIHAALNNDRMDLQVHEEYYQAVAKRNKAKRWILIYGIIYILFKIKQFQYGKFSLSRNVRVLEIASLVTIIGGYPLIKGIYKRFTRKIPADSDLLLTLAAASLTLLRESAKGVLILLLKAFTDYVKYAADVECMRALRQSKNATSGMAYLLQDSRENLVPVHELQKDDLILARSGEVISAEGEITEGEAIVNSLYHLGQPLAAHLEKGSKVFDGMILLSGEVKIKVTGIPDAGGKEDISIRDIRSYQRIENYTKNITYVSLGLAAIKYLITGSALGAISIMLVFSPSAAGTAFSSGLKNYVSLLNKKKIYVRNPNVIERLAVVNDVVFDKTGTLTYGNMQIIQVESFDSRYTEQELLKICAACEVNHYHPISVTLQNESEGQYDIEKVQSSVLLPSKGIKADYDNRNVLIGNRELMEEYHVDISKGSSLYEETEKQLCTPVYVALDNVLTGMISLKDVIRTNAPELIRKLKYRGITNISLLTGDNENKARHTASILGIDKIYSNCSYEEKERIINRHKQNGTVMMIGDGVNDIRSMQAADISVSFINSACDKVKLHSDCVIIEDDLTRLPDLISLSQKSYGRIRQSIAASCLYNIFFGVMAFCLTFDPFAAKSINTINSLMVLLLNQRISYLTPGRIT